MSTEVKGNGGSACGCSDSKPPVEAKATRLEDLIPIAMVIAAGCESCAEKMVLQALERGSSQRDIQKTLAIIAHLQRLDCFAQAVGEEAVARMEKPLLAGRRTSQLLARRSGC